MAVATRRGERRGSVLVTVLLVLLLTLLFIIGVVAGTARDLDVSARRLETVRAFYAAEGGINMAYREIALVADEDGDGTIGAISDDGTDASDPVVGSARVRVSVSVAGANPTLVSAGRDGGARREITATVE